MKSELLWRHVYYFDKSRYTTSECESWNKGGVLFAMNMNLPICFIGYSRAGYYVIWKYIVEV